MKIEVLSIEKATAEAQKMPYAMIRTAEKVALGKNALQWNAEEVTYARFFDGVSEIRIFRDDGQLCAVALRGETDDHTIEEDYEIENSEAFGKMLKVRKILAFDEDGQAFVKESLLCGWEE